MTSAQSDAPPSSAEFVRKNLFDFLRSHLTDISEESIDEIVLDYIVSIVEDLTASEVADKDESALDLESLVEMLTAYIPGVETIPEMNILSWMFKLAEDLKRIDKKETKVEFDIKSVIEETTVPKPKPQNGMRTPKTSESDFYGMESKNSKIRINRLSETSDGGSEGSTDSEDFQMVMKQLQEMFPYACSLEINHCLQLVGWEVETAAQLIMHRHEAGQALKPSDKRTNKFSQKVDYDDKAVKDRILGKYGFVDQEEDARYHRPTLKKEDSKKLIRYRDGKIVSTKGERFTQISKHESEDLKKSIKRRNY